MVDNFKETLETSARIAALEMVLTDLLAKVYRTTPDAIEAISKSRESFREVFSRNEAHGLGDVPGLTEIATGEIGDAVDRLLETVEKSLRRQKPGPQWRS